MFYHKQLIKECCLKLELISSYDDSIMNKPLLNSEDTYVEVIKKYNKLKIQSITFNYKKL